jgi:phosphatidylinositol-3-phosphatase
MKGRRTTTAVIILVVVVFLGAVYVIGREHKNVTPHTSNSPQSSQPPSKQQTAFAHIFVILEENKPIGNVIGNANAPYINSLAKQYALATDYYGVSHPSLPNYLALTSGSTDNTTTDCTPPSAGCEVSVANVADELESSGHTWKEYAESMPSDCYAHNSGKYVTKHNPFVYYSDIINNASRCKKHVVPFGQMTSDLKPAQTTPDYAFITPNLCNDMHDCSVSTGDKWLAKYVPKILGSKAFTSQNSLLVITWDEGDSSTNHIAAILAGSKVKQGYQSAKRYNHYSLLHTIEANWGLPGLTNNDKQAPTMSESFN